MQKKCKILFVISGVDYSLGFDWLDKYLDREKFIPMFIFLNSSKPQILDILLGRKSNAIFFRLNSRKDYPFLFFKIVRMIRSFKPDIVHTHLLDANFLGISAAWFCNVKRRIYTRHHSTYHFDYHPHMVKFDKLVNTMSTHIAAISSNVRDVLIEKEGVPPSKVFMVEHGFELRAFIDVDLNKVELLCNKYNPDHRKPVIGVISRFTEWKGIQFVIPAFKKLLDKYPSALLVLANAKGDYYNQITDQLKVLPEKSYICISFEKDLFSLYKLFNIFVHVPIDPAAEAFGQTYIESLAAGIPSVFTLSGIAREFVVNEVNALVVNYKNSSEIEMALIRLLENEQLRNTLVKRGREDVLERFQVQNMMASLYKLYES